MKLVKLTLAMVVFVCGTTAIADEAILKPGKSVEYSVFVSEFSISHGNARSASVVWYVSITRGGGTSMLDMAVGGSRKGKWIRADLRSEDTEYEFIRGKAGNLLVFAKEPGAVTLPTIQLCRRGSEPDGSGSSLAICRKPVSINQFPFE
ncbi:MAG: hypothetical protein ABJO09_00055 [Hyphomicrobiales bacterium]